MREVRDLLHGGLLSHGDPELFRPLTDELVRRDPYLVLEDFRSYNECQEQAIRCWIDEPAWTRKAILNVARIGGFCTDRAIRQYCEDIWKVHPLVAPPPT